MNSVGNFITSVKAVMIAMFLIIIALVFDSHTLFIRTLPSDMSPFTKQVAAWGMAIGFEFTVLLTTANANYVHKRTNVLLAICTFLMTLFFFNVFNEVEIISVFRIVFVSVLVAFINYIYAELFVKKWKEYKESQLNKSDLQVQFDNLNEAYWETKLLAIDLENQTKVHEENISILKNELTKHDIVTQNYEHKLIIEKEKNEILQQEITDLKKRLSRKRESTLEA